MKKSKIQIIICCFFLSFIVFPAFSNEFSYEIICGKFFPSNGYINLIANNQSEKEVIFYEFKRNAFAAFLVISDTGEILKDPNWSLKYYRNPSNGATQRYLPARDEQFLSSVSKRYQSLIEAFLKKQNKNLYITAVVHKLHGDRIVIEQSPFYKLFLKMDKLFCEKIDKKLIPCKVNATAEKEKETILMEEASTEYIWH